MEAREGFTKSTESQIKCATGLNMHYERTKLIDKGNMHAVCPACNVIYTWEHVVSCEKITNKRDYWVNKLSKKLNDAVNKVKVSTHERKIVNEMIKDVRKHFNRDIIFLTTQQVLGMREVFQSSSR